MPSCVIIVFLFVQLSILSAQSQEVSLGGIRKVTAQVECVNNVYHCSVRFLPVRCFGSSTNQRINRKKSRTYAIRALALSVGVKNGRVSIKHLAPEAPLKRDGEYLVAKYSADSIVLLGDSVKPKKHTKVSKNLQKREKLKTPKLEDKLSSKDEKLIEASLNKGPSLLTCLADYQATIQNLRELAESEVAHLSLKQVNSQEELEGSIAEIEEQSQKSFDQLSSKIRSEKLLLSSEKKGLISEIKKEKTDFLNRLIKKYSTLRDELQKQQAQEQEIEAKKNATN